MKLCEDENPMQLWERKRPSKKIYDETKIAGYQFVNRKYPHLCMDYSKIKRKGGKYIFELEKILTQIVIELKAMIHLMTCLG